LGDLNTQPDTNGYNYLTDENMRSVVDLRVDEEDHHYYGLIDEQMHSGLKGKFSSAFQNYD
jgi:endonuclease/exonuclease/phosphatase family metal-dependent hydrolase